MGWRGCGEEERERGGSNSQSLVSKEEMKKSKSREVEAGLRIGRQNKSKKKEIESDAPF